jgi:hypothetical protein
MVDGTIDSELQEQRLQEYITDNNQYEGLIISIEDDVTDGAWAEFYADVSTKRKEREKWFEDLKEPINKALAVLRAKEHQACDKLREIEDTITQARGNWHRVKLQRTDEANKKAIKDAAGSGGVAIIGQSPAKSVVTSGGTTVGLRTQPSWRFTDDNTITAKEVERKKMKFSRAEPRLKNVPDEAFHLVASMIMPLIKAGTMPEGPHSIERFDDFASTSK